MYNLFQSVVLHQNIKIDNNKLLKYIYKIKKQDKGRILSNEGGWQSLEIGENQKELEELKDNIEKKLLEYLDNVKLKHSKNYVYNIWLNINGYKDSNVLHNHPKSIVSGVYYIKTPSKCGGLVLHHPCREIAPEWNRLIIEYTPANSTTWKLPVVEGDLVLFPSWLYHSVDLNLNKKDVRVSIAFNICE